MNELVAQRGDGGVIALNRKGNVATPFTLRSGGKIKIAGIPGQ